MALRCSLLMLLASFCLAGCAEKRRIVYLVDGRTIEVSAFHNDGMHIHFKANGWEYNLPVALLAKEKPEKPRAIQRVTVTTNRVYMQGWVFHGLHDFFLYVDTMPRKGFPVIVEIPDAAYWSEERMKIFGGFYGKLENRPHVGLEGYWRKDKTPR